MLLAAMWSLHIRRLAQARRQTSLICALEPGSASNLPAKLPKAATVPRLRVRVAMSTGEKSWQAGPQRLRARDRWNVEDLRICDIMSRSLGWTGSQLDLDENDVAEILTELYGAPAQEPYSARADVALIGDLHYALRAHHMCHFLPQATMRTLATTNVSSRGCVDRELLRDLMEELNGGYTVLAAQVNAVLDEAEALAACGSGSGRASLVRAISAWYLNVLRTESPWATTFRACYGRWVPEKGYHWEVFVRFRVSLTEAEEAFHEDVWQAVWGLIQSAILLLALVFPIMFFAWLVVLGAEHGDDRCPKDLDGLMTWFGMLGLALIVVGFVDGRLAQEDVVKTSYIGLALSLVLLVLPWVGAFWTFHLDSTDQQTCGLTVCLVSELILGFAFLWHLAVYQEYEMTLQQGHSLEQRPSTFGNRQEIAYASSSARKCSINNSALQPETHPLYLQGPLKPGKDAKILCELAVRCDIPAPKASDLAGSRVRLGLFCHGFTCQHCQVNEGFGELLKPQEDIEPGQAASNVHILWPTHVEVVPLTEDIGGWLPASFHQKLASEAVRGWQNFRDKIGPGLPRNHELYRQLNQKHAGALNDAFFHYQKRLFEAEGDFDRAMSPDFETSTPPPDANSSWPDMNALPEHNKLRKVVERLSRRIELPSQRRDLSRRVQATMKTLMALMTHLPDLLWTPTCRHKHAGGVPRDTSTSLTRYPQALDPTWLGWKRSIRRTPPCTIGLQDKKLHGGRNASDKYLRH
eukprot:s1250_g10.t1